MVPEEARRHILGHGAMLVSEGIVAGIVGAAMPTRLLSSFLFDVSALDLRSQPLSQLPTRGPESFVPEKDDPVPESSGLGESEQDLLL
jgi:hypothetical protein